MSIKQQVLADLFHVYTVLQFQNELTDVLRLHLGNSGFVGTQHPATKPLAQATAHLNSGSMDNLFLTMTQEDVRQVVIWWIVECLSLGYQLLI